jgi:hypothetical protein
MKRDARLNLALLCLATIPFLYTILKEIKRSFNKNYPYFSGALKITL